jgi:hypothetical protein
MDNVGSLNNISKQIKNMQHVGGQVKSMKTKDLKPNPESGVKDNVSLSEQARKSQHVGETTGMAGRTGAKENKLRTEDEVLDRRHQLGEDKVELGKDEKDTSFVMGKDLKQAGDFMGEALSELSPEKRQMVANLNDQVNAFAAQEEERTGQPINKAALLAREILTNENLQEEGKLQNAAGNFLQADLANDQDNLKRLMTANPGTTVNPGVFDSPGPIPQLNPAGGGVNPAMVDPRMMADPRLMAAGGGLPPGQIPPGGMLPGQVPPMPPGMVPGQQVPGSTTPYTDAATKQQTSQTDLQTARTIYAEMAAERKKWLARMWQIQQDCNTKIYEIIQQVLVNKATTIHNMAMKWDAYIRDAAQ